MTFELGPAGSASGQIIDEATGQPLANRKLRHFLRIRQEDKLGAYSGGWREVFGGTATTDKDGKFQITGLVPSQRYHLTTTGDQNTPRRLRTFEVTAGEKKQLGRVVLPKPKPTIDQK